MSNSLKVRIIFTLLLGSSTFLIFYILHKLLLYSDNWFYHSIQWTFLWSAGFFIARTIAVKTKEHKSTLNLLVTMVIVIIVEIILSFLFILTMLFITKVMLSLSNWNYVFSNICFPFVESLFISNIFLLITN